MTTKPVCYACGKAATGEERCAGERHPDACPMVAEVRRARIVGLEQEVARLRKSAGGITVVRCDRCGAECIDPWPHEVAEGRFLARFAVLERARRAVR